MKGLKISKAKRLRLYLPVGGEGEQALIKWFQLISDEKELNTYLDCQPLGGGGRKTMLKSALRYRWRNERWTAKECILLVDGDRTEMNDGWSLSQLKDEASKHNIIVCVQNPNLEGLLLRMIPGNENLKLNPMNVQRKLRNAWPNYEKPIDARTLYQKYSIDDVHRVARVDPEIKKLLTTVKLYP